MGVKMSGKWWTLFSGWVVFASATVYWTIREGGFTLTDNHVIGALEILLAVDMLIHYASLELRDRDGLRFFDAFRGFESAVQRVVAARVSLARARASRAEARSVNGVQITPSSCSIHNHVN